MNYVVDKGLGTKADVPYTGFDGACGNDGTSLISHDDDSNLEEMIAVGFHEASVDSAGAALGLRGWERLPENKYAPLIQAVAETGPVAVAVAANAWSSYGSGIFDGCGRDAIIDHGVTLIGYGGKDSDKYWIIKNSWGNSWGENGNIRLLREVGDSDERCGTDNQPSVGTGCDGGPSSVRVCGMCGILYDAVVARFHNTSNSIL